MSFQGIDLFLRGQCVLHTVFHAHLDTFGRGLVTERTGYVSNTLGLNGLLSASLSNGEVKKMAQRERRAMLTVFINPRSSRILARANNHAAVCRCRSFGQSA
jgi:hypothetical protein